MRTGGRGGTASGTTGGGVFFVSIWVSRCCGLLVPLIYVLRFRAYHFSVGNVTRLVKATSGSVGHTIYVLFRFSHANLW